MFWVVKLKASRTALSGRACMAQARICWNCPAAVVLVPMHMDRCSSTGVLCTLLPQTFELPASACIGQYLRINLHGKRQRQESDGLFYTAICAVTAHGRKPPLLLPALAPYRLHAHPRMQLDSVRMPACSPPCADDAWARWAPGSATADDRLHMPGVRRGRERGGAGLGRGRTAYVRPPAAVFAATLLGRSAGAARLGGQCCRRGGCGHVGCPAADLARGAWGTGGLRYRVGSRRRRCAADGGVTEQVPFMCCKYLCTIS